MSRIALLSVLPRGFPAFIVVGSIGFLVDASVLAALVHGYGWGDYSARAVSFAVAVTVTWLLNRVFSFAAGRTDDRRTEYARYVAVQGIGMAINFAVYAACIVLSPFMDRWPVVALAAGCSVSLAFNYTGMRVFVFTGSEEA